MPTGIEHPEVLLVLDGKWRTSRQVHAMLGMWSPITVKHALNGLAAAGVIESRMETRSAGQRRRVYRARERAHVD